MEPQKLLAVVRIRGNPDLKREARDAFRMLRLTRVNHCVLIPDSPSFSGMLAGVKHFITYGEINKETLEKLVFKRGRLAGDKKIEKSRAKEIAEKIWKEKSVKSSGLKPVFRLNPPSKGYKSIKSLYPKGDAGYRGDKINLLLKRMI